MCRPRITSVRSTPLCFVNLCLPSMLLNYSKNLFIYSFTCFKSDLGYFVTQKKGHDILKQQTSEIVAYYTFPNILNLVTWNEKFSSLVISKLKANSALNTWRQIMKMSGSGTLHEGKTHILQWFIPLLTEHFTMWLDAIQNIHSHMHLPQEVASCNSYPVQ